MLDWVNKGLGMTFAELACCCCCSSDDFRYFVFSGHSNGCIFVASKNLTDFLHARLDQGGDAYGFYLLSMLERLHSHGTRPFGPKPARTTCIALRQLGPSLRCSPNAPP